MKTKKEVMDVLEANIEFANQLLERWEYEKEYEDINDYRDAFEKRIGMKVHRVTKSPLLGFQVKAQGGIVILKPKPQGNYINWHFMFRPNK
jgi:hypothetical protein